MHVAVRKLLQIVAQSCLLCKIIGAPKLGVFLQLCVCVGVMVSWLVR